MKRRAAAVTLRQLRRASVSGGEPRTKPTPARDPVGGVVGGLQPALGSGNGTAPGTLAASFVLGTAPLEALIEKWPLIFTSYLLKVVMVFFLVSLWEEIG